MKNFIKKNWFKLGILSILLLLVLLGVYCFASSTSRYNKISLQENCSKKADEIFTEFKKNNEAKVIFTGDNYTYSNHYNEKLNKCFVLLERDSEYDADISLYNAYENIKIGEYIEVRPSGDAAICFVDNNRECKNYEEFSNLIKKYMEN